MRSIEKKELIISWITISVAFASVWSGIFQFDEFIHFLPISFVAVGTGFIFHELAHRTVAKHYGCLAEFRMWKEGLILALVLPIITFGRFFFAAPGAVYIYGPHLTRRENGIISLAGPLTNTIVAIVFLTILFLLPNTLMFPYVKDLCLGVAHLNLWFAFFNLIPIPPLDGSKVISWNPIVWGLAFFPLSIYTFLPYLKISAHMWV